MSHKFESIFRLGFIAILISGCTTQVPVDDEIRIQNWQLHNEKLQKLITWEIKGRISMSIDREAWSASLHWQQDNQEYLLKIIAPLGRGTIELQGNESGVDMRLQRDEIKHAKDPESLLADTFGWSVPVSGLLYWIRGLPDPEIKTSKILFDANGRITDMEQSGWQLRYSGYNDEGDYQLPGKIYMNSGNLKIRLVIRDWSI